MSELMKGNLRDVYQGKMAEGILCTRMTNIRFPFEVGIDGLEFQAAGIFLEEAGR